MGFPASLKYENLCPHVPISRRLRRLSPLGSDETEGFCFGGVGSHHCKPLAMQLVAHCSLGELDSFEVTFLQMCEKEKLSCKFLMYIIWGRNVSGPT